MNSYGNTWALVLAAGEGSRLRTLTTTSAGQSVPKQFCSLTGGPSLLQEALHRAESVARSRRVCAVVAAQHRRWWEVALWSLPSGNIVVQPENRGTAFGILLPLLHIAARDPDASVLLLPSDHHVRDEQVLARSLRQLSALARQRPAEVLMLGVSPDYPDPELGYIVPGGSDRHGALRVRRFVEKPSQAVAERLMEEGACWNSFILAGRVAAFLALYEARIPVLLGQLGRAVEADLCAIGRSTETERLYDVLPSLDFSRDILEGQEYGLRLFPAPACGWSDLGTPMRVAEALSRLPAGQLSTPFPFVFAADLNLAAQHHRLQLAS